MLPNCLPECYAEVCSHGWSLCFPTFLTVPNIEAQAVHGKAESGKRLVGSLRRPPCPSEPCAPACGLWPVLGSCLLESAHAHRLLSAGLFCAQPCTCKFSVLVFTATSVTRTKKLGAQGNEITCSDPKAANGRWGLNPAVGDSPPTFCCGPLPPERGEDMPGAPYLLSSLSTSASQKLAQATGKVCQEP